MIRRGRMNTYPGGCRLGRINSQLQRHKAHLRGLRTVGAGRLCDFVGAVSTAVEVGD